MKKLFIVSLVFILAACDQINSYFEKSQDLKSNEAKATQAMTGVWYGAGEVDESGADLEWLESWEIERKADGTYRYDLLQVNKKERSFKRYSETGTWKYKMPIYTETNDEGSENNYIVYIITPERFEYYLPDWDKDKVRIYEYKEMPKNFTMTPPADYKEIIESSTSSNTEE